MCLPVTLGVLEIIRRPSVPSQAYSVTPDKYVTTVRCHIFLLFTLAPPENSCTGYLVHPFEKDDLGFLDRSFPLAWNSMEGQEEPVYLAGWREEDSIRQGQRIRSGSMRGGKP
jgi:hypothetical protein